MQVHAYCVCDDPDYFYDFSQNLLDGLQAGVSSRDIVEINNVSFTFILILLHIVNNALTLVYHFQRLAANSCICLFWVTSDFCS